MSKNKIKIVTIQTSYGEEVCCIQCGRVNILQKTQSSEVNLIPMIYNKIIDWCSDRLWNKKINSNCYNCKSIIDPGDINSFYRKRRGNWVLIPAKWVHVGPTAATIRERKSLAKEKRTKLKSNHGKIISKAAFRLQKT